MHTLKRSQHKRLKSCLSNEDLSIVEESRGQELEEQRVVPLTAQRFEDEIRQQEEIKRKNRQQRDNVIAELEVTEREFCRVLKLTWLAFDLDTPAMLEQAGVDVATLFGNFADVIDISERFLDTLEEGVKSKPNPEDQMVGKCFLQHSETMKSVYTEYCINHDKAEQLLEKYDSMKEIQKILQKGVETLQSQVSCFSIGSILIKPVQRILKYPLILNELIKCTEDAHRDRVDLMDAICIMSDVASFINESKRRKDIVDKYKSEEDKTISQKISKLNLHSIGKKSTRISTKFLSSIGIDPVNRDLDFDDYEKRFSFLTCSVQSFLSDSQRFREHQYESVVSQHNIAETIAELYKDQVHLREVERFRMAHRNIIETHWNEYNSKVNPRVIQPLQILLENLQGPSRLIQKRHDKQLDLQASTQKSEKNRDPTKTKSYNEEVDKCRANFEALNSQLLEQLPKLLDVAGSIFSDSVNDLVLLRKLFIGRATKELLSLMDLPFLASASGDILESFLEKHSMVCNQLGRFSFSSKAFKPEDKNETSQSIIGQKTPFYEEIQRGSSVSSSSCSSNCRSVISGGSNNNNDEVGIPVQSGKFYYALYDFTAKEPTMLSLFRGQVVRVVHVRSVEWCYVEDRNSNKGYVPGPYLKLYTTTQPNVPSIVPNSTIANDNNNNNIINEKSV